MKMKNGKTPGLYIIPPEVMKADLVVTADIMIHLLQNAWDEEELPMEWKTGYIVNIAKKEILATAGIGEESNFYHFQAKSTLG